MGNMFIMIVWVFFSGESGVLLGINLLRDIIVVPFFPFALPVLQ